MLGDALELLISRQMQDSNLLKTFHVESRSASIIRRRINLAKDAEIALRKYILYLEDNK
jgi:hypothetical protein